MAELSSTNIYGTLNVTSGIIATDLKIGANSVVTTISTSGALSVSKSANTYTITHSTSDGYLHVPATGTGNNGKYLKAGSAAGSLSWTAIFDGTAPSTQKYGDAASAGTATVAARRDHKHAMPAIYQHPSVNHIPTGGASGNILQYSSSGAAAWKANGTTSQYLRGDGTWATPPDTVYTHPTTSGNKHIPSGGSSGQFLKWSADGTAVWGADNNTTYTAGSGLTLTGTQFSHTDTSSAANLSASGRRYVTGLTFDTYGHVTGYTTGTETVTDTNTATAVSKLLKGSNSGTAITYDAYPHGEKAAGRFYYGTVNPTNTNRLNWDGNLHANEVRANLFAGNISGFLNVYSNNEATIHNGFAGGVVHINYRGSSGTGITQYNMCNGLSTGDLASISALKVFNAVYNDYAEYFERGGDTEPGDIIAKIPGVNKYTKATENSIIVGVQSDFYAHIIGGEHNKTEEEQLENFIPVGVAGRVKVKVIGDISEGDLITLSNISGVGTNCTTYVPGTIVGKALEHHHGKSIDKIWILIMNC